jgi:hypothetical protein
VSGTSRSISRCDGAVPTRPAADIALDRFPAFRRARVRPCIACKFIQGSGLVPKKRANRKAVSAVTDRSPLAMG